ncbi:MAG: SH3 domain-containing protein [bacterium]|nr:SH3 domain-containing protein [bacterium]
MSSGFFKHSRLVFFVCLLFLPSSVAAEAGSDPLLRLREYQKSREGQENNPDVAKLRELENENRRLQVQVEGLDAEVKRLHTILDEARVEADRQKNYIEELQFKMQQSEGQPLPGEKIRHSDSKTVVELKKVNEELAAALQQIEQLKSVEADNIYIRGELEKLQSTKKDKASDLAELQAQLSGSKAELVKCEEQSKKDSESLRESESLKKQLIEATNELMLARAEVESVRGRYPELMGSRPVQTQADPRATQSGGTTLNVPPVSVVSGGGVNRDREPLGSDVVIVQVIVPKAVLRSGPGVENSAVMTVTKGARLTVEERRGSWYRVVSPNGGRAFISSDVVDIFDDGKGGGPKGADDADAAFEALRAMRQG